MKNTLSWIWFLFTSIILPFFVISIAYNSYESDAVLISIGIIIYTTIAYGIDIIVKSQSVQFLSLGEKIVWIEQATELITEEQRDVELEEIRDAASKSNKDEPKRIIFYLSLFVMQIIAVMAMMSSY